MKLSKEEVEVMKDCFYKGFFYITRDENRTLVACKKVLKKGGDAWNWWYNAMACEKRILEEDFFKFIEWEKPIPFDIRDLFEVVFKGEAE